MQFNLIRMRDTYGLSAVELFDSLNLLTENPLSSPVKWSAKGHPDLINAFHFCPIYTSNGNTRSLTIETFQRSFPLFLLIVTSYTIYGCKNPLNFLHSVSITTLRNPLYTQKVIMRVQHRDWHGRVFTSIFFCKAFKVFFESSKCLLWKQIKLDVPFKQNFSFKNNCSEGACQIKGPFSKVCATEIVNLLVHTYFVQLYL